MVKKARQINFTQKIHDTQKSPEFEKFVGKKLQSLSDMSSILTRAETREVSYEQVKVEKRIKPYRLKKKIVSLSELQNVPIDVKELNFLNKPAVDIFYLALNSTNGYQRNIDFISKHGFTLECR